MEPVRPTPDMTLDPQAVVEAALARLGRQPDALLPLLHAVQDALGHVPRSVVQPLAQALNLSSAEVHGVLSAYPHFRTHAPGRHVLRVCRAEACQAMGGQVLWHHAQQRLGLREMGEGGTSDDGCVTLEAVHCLGLCATSPAVALDDRPQARMSPDALDEWLDAVQGDAVTPRAASTGWTAPMPESTRVWVPGDSAACAVGADEVAQAITAQAAALGLDVQVMRNGSRGLFWLEPLIEVETPAGRVAYGPVAPEDVPGLLASGLLQGAPHALWQGRVEQLPALQRQQRLTFHRAGWGEPLSLSDYEALGGWQGLRQALALPAAEVVQAVTDSGLRGRGGAAFAAGIKWRTVAQAASAQKYLLCNADEGDSGTFSDRLLMEGDPYALIEGLAIAARAVGATRGYIYVRSEYPRAVDVMTEAVARATAAGFLGESMLGSGLALHLEVRKGAGSYVCGEETALLESLEGRRGTVRAKPPLPALQGLFGQPTLIHNVITLASVPPILAQGAQAYQGVGRDRSRGTLPFQLAGNIRRGGLVECAFGITLRELVFDVGGGTASGRPVKAIQVGGPLGAYVPELHWDVPMDYESYAAFGAVIGHGGVVVHDDTANLAQLARHAMAFCAQESCGKCTPCRIGSTRGVEVIDRLLAAQGPAQQAPQVQLLRSLCDTLQHGSLCAMGGMTPYPVLSALDHYPQDFGLPEGVARS